MSKDELLTPTQVCKLLNVKNSTLVSWRHRKMGPTYIAMSTSTIRYLKSSVLKFLAKRTVVQTEADNWYLRRFANRKFVEDEKEIDKTLKGLYETVQDITYDDLI